MAVANVTGQSFRIKKFNNNNISFYVNGQKYTGLDIAGLAGEIGLDSDVQTLLGDTEKLKKLDSYDLAGDKITNANKTGSKQSVLESLIVFCLDVKQQKIGSEASVSINNAEIKAGLKSVIDDSITLDIKKFKGALEGSVTSKSGKNSADSNVISKDFYQLTQSINLDRLDEILRNQIGITAIDPGSIPVKRKEDITSRGAAPLISDDSVYTSAAELYSHFAEFYSDKAELKTDLALLLLLVDTKTLKELDPGIIKALKGQLSNLKKEVSGWSFSDKQKDVDSAVRAILNTLGQNTSRVSIAANFLKMYINDYVPSKDKAMSGENFVMTMLMFQAANSGSSAVNIENELTENEINVARKEFLYIIFDPNKNYYVVTAADLEFSDAEIDELAELLKQNPKLYDFYNGKFIHITEGSRKNRAIIEGFIKDWSNTDMLLRKELAGFYGKEGWVHAFSKMFSRTEDVRTLFKKMIKGNLFIFTDEKPINKDNPPQAHFRRQRTKISKAWQAINDLGKEGKPAISHPMAHIASSEGMTPQQYIQDNDKNYEKVTANFRSIANSALTEFKSTYFKNNSSFSFSNLIDGIADNPDNVVALVGEAFNGFESEINSEKSETNQEKDSIRAAARNMLLHISTLLAAAKKIENAPNYEITDYQPDANQEPSKAYILQAALGTFILMPDFRKSVAQNVVADRILESIKVISDNSNKDKGFEAIEKIKAAMHGAVEIP